MSEIYTPDKLIAGGFPLTTGGVTVATGQTLTRGTVLGIKTATGEAAPVNNALADGTEDPYCVLAQDVDTTDGATEAPVYISGEFNEAALLFGGDDTIDDHRAVMRTLSLFTNTNVAA